MTNGSATAAVFCCGFSENKPPAKPVRKKSFSFKNKTSNVKIDEATNRISKQRRN
jgi:hypothetical protein